jgi:hypothetical protein
MDLFPSLGERRETPTLLGPLERANFNHWTTHVELSLSYGRRSVDQFVLVSGSPLGPMTRFYPYPFFSDSFHFLFDERTGL